MGDVPGVVPVPSEGPLINLQEQFSGQIQRLPFLNVQGPERQILGQILGASGDPQGHQPPPLNLEEARPGVGVGGTFMGTERPQMVVFQEENLGQLVLWQTHLGADSGESEESFDGPREAKNRPLQILSPPWWWKEARGRKIFLPPPRGKE